MPGSIGAAFPAPEPGPAFTEGAFLSAALATSSVSEPGMSSIGGRRLPNLAVAIGPNVYIYRRMRPFFRFTVPVPDVSQEEKSGEGARGGGAWGEGGAARRSL